MARSSPLRRLQARAIFLHLLLFLLFLLLRPPTTQAFPHDATIVTDLRVVHGTNDEAAREACAAMCPCRNALTPHVTTNWFVVGANLHTNGDGGFAYLCMRQDRRTAVERDGGSLFALQSLAVIENAHAKCPSSMVKLFTPRDNVAVCMQLAPMADALATGTYVSEVDAVLAGGAGSPSADGWIGVPTSVHTADAYAPSVFLRFKRPVRPIIGVRMLSGVDMKTSGATACRRQLNSSWEQAGTGYIVDDADPSKRSVLCVQRVYAPSDVEASEGGNEPSVPRVLTQIAILPWSSSCEGGFQEQVAFSSSWKACLRYDETSSPTTHRSLSYVALTTNASWEGMPLVPGLSLAPDVDVNNARSGVSTYVAIQESNGASDRRQLVSGETNTKKTTSGVAKPLASKPPLRARVVDTNTSDPKLTFKVLQITDLHLTGDPDRYCLGPPTEHAACGMQCTENLTIAFVNDLLDKEKPDLVVFSGDAITVRDWALKDAALDAALGPVEARGIPYAYIMGNHDDDWVYDRQEIMDKLLLRELAYVESGPKTIQGVGNYVLDIKPPVAATSGDEWGDPNSTVFRLYFLDSNKNRDAELFPKIRSRYDWIRPEQIAFYRELSLRNRETDAGVVPAIMFFHIPIPEYSSIGSFFFRNGEKHEKLEGPDFNSGMFETLAELQEVKATFVGHDHTNEYCYDTQGVQLCYGGGTGFGAAYYDGSVARRARVIEWTMDSAKHRRLRSWKRHFGHRFHSRQREEELFSES